MASINNSLLPRELWISKGGKEGEGGCAKKGKEEEGKRVGWGFVGGWGLGVNIREKGPRWVSRESKLGLWRESFFLNQD